MRKNRAAGFVVVSSGLRSILVLKRDGVGDLPKGVIEIGEGSLEGALRECYEEAGILIGKDSIISRSPYDCNKVDFYVAVQDGDPVIRPNPKSGIIEHEWCGWLTWREADEILSPYLKPAARYAKALCNIVTED